MGCDSLLRVHLLLVCCISNMSYSEELILFYPCTINKKNNNAGFWKLQILFENQKIYDRMLSRQSDLSVII